MTKTIQRPRGNSRKPKPRSPWRWVGFAAAPLVLAVLVAVSVLSESDDAEIDQAIPFELSAAADGQIVSLDETLAQGDALLYFSMGVGCDGCFAQIPELDTAVAERGLSLVPIMVDPAQLVAAEAARFGIEGPILIDPGAKSRPHTAWSVSTATAIDPATASPWSGRPARSPGFATTPRCSCPRSRCSTSWTPPSRHDNDARPLPLPASDNQTVFGLTADTAR